jgi:hypothetical protein
MSPEEIKEIIRKGLQTLGMEIVSDALDRIVLLSQGLPHYAHLMGRHSARTALSQQKLSIELGDINAAITKGIEDAQQSIKTAYHYALISPRKHNLFGDVLLACALAELDSRGTFAAQDVRGPLRKITDQDYGIPTFAQHLNEFSDNKRGNILTKLGETKALSVQVLRPADAALRDHAGCHRREGVGGNVAVVKVCSPLPFVSTDERGQNRKGAPRLWRRVGGVPWWTA